MPRMVDLTGQKFGRLAVLERTGSKYGKVQWKCRCDCGNEVVVSGSNLKCGNTKSCGCYNKERKSEVHKKHGMRKSRLYSIWVNMRDRCYREKSIKYHSYGAKGIAVCNEWLGADGFENFAKWAVPNGYADNLTLDRIDGTKGYSPDNCRWVTYKKQANNTKANIMIEHNGETHTMHEWSDILGLNYQRFHRALRIYNMPFDKAVDYCLNLDDEDIS